MGEAFTCRALQLFLAGVVPAWGADLTVMDPGGPSAAGAPAPESIVHVEHLTVEGTVWQYAICGSGHEVALLLTGGLREGAPREFMELLSRRYRVIVPDYPPVHDIDKLIRGMAAILEHEQAGRTHLLGASLGGMIAQCFVRQHPQRVASMVLANTSGPVRWAATLMTCIRYTIYVIPFPVLKPLAKWGALRLIRPDTPQQRRRVEAAIRERFDGKQARAALITLVYRVEDFHRRKFTSADLEGWAGRILIIESDDDPGVPRRYREQLKHLYPGAVVHTFHGAGHAPSMSHREELAAVIKQFMKIE